MKFRFNWRKWICILREKDDKFKLYNKNKNK